jgi:hypothetical protein
MLTPSPLSWGSPSAETPEGPIAEFRAAKRVAQRRIDAITLGMHRLLHTPRQRTGVRPRDHLYVDWERDVLRSMGSEKFPDDAPVGEPVMFAVTLTATLEMGEGEYAEKGEVIPVECADARELIRYGRAREATDEDIDRHNARAEQERVG